MTHVTVLLIVLSLSGAPVANAACASWCASESMPCCDMASMPMAPTVADASCTCAAAMADVPMLREDTARYMPALFAVLPPAAHGHAERASRVRTLADVAARDGRPAPLLVLRL